jgi:predicted transcriptional regulator
MAEQNLRERWEAVRRETDTHKAVHMLADLGEDNIIAAMKERAEMRAQMLTLVKILIGNGDPSHSMINRVDDLEKTFEKCKESLVQIQRLLMGDLTTGMSEDSIIDKVKKADKMANVAIKLGWIVLGILVAQIVTTVLGLL